MHLSELSDQRELRKEGNERDYGLCKETWKIECKGRRRGAAAAEKKRCGQWVS